GAEVQVVDTVCGEARGAPLGVARIPPETVAHDQAVDRQLVLECLHPPREVGDGLLDVLHGSILPLAACVARWPRDRQCSTQEPWLDDSKARWPSSPAAATASDARRRCASWPRVRACWWPI